MRSRTDRSQDDGAATPSRGDPRELLAWLRARIFARRDPDTATWSSGWLRWPTGPEGTLVTALLVIKLVITAWNCAAFDGLSYDQAALHVSRARTAGLGTDGRAYNPPLYYLGAAPALAWQSISDWDSVPRDATPTPLDPGRSDGEGHTTRRPAAAMDRGAALLEEEPDAEGEVEVDAQRVGARAPHGPRVDRTANGPAHTAADPALDRKRKLKDRQLLRSLRWTNFGYLTIFYVAWIGAILPRLITDPRRAWIATLLLLAVPGYQKLAAMVHPDNALSAVTALGIAVWLILRDDSRPPGWRVLGLALCAGLVTLTRPFGILPGAALLVACAVLVVRERRTLDSGTFARVIACAAITGALAMSWPAYQVATLGRLSPVYKDSYIEPYLPHRPDFDRIGYFASFYPIELLEVPSRRLHDRDTEHDRFHNKYGNSFWTLLYSETWGEHWLYFSGRYNVENKLWAKRAILLAALPTIPLLLLGFARGIAAAAASILRWRREPDADKALFLTVFLALGVLMYLYWHLDAGLTPGKNSSVKFIYNAYLYPVGIALCFFAPASRVEMRGWPSYATILYVASLPLVFYLPRWLIS